MGSFWTKFLQVFIFAYACSYYLFLTLKSFLVSIFIHLGLDHLNLPVAHTIHWLSVNVNFWWLDLPLISHSKLYIYHLSLLSITNLIHSGLPSFISYYSPRASKLTEKVLTPFQCPQSLRNPWPIYNLK